MLNAISRLVCIELLAASAVLAAAGLPVQAADPAAAPALPFTLTFEPGQLQRSALGDYTVLGWPEARRSHAAGCPDVPVQLVRVAVPEGFAVDGVRIVSLESQELAGLHRLPPAQPPRRISDPQPVAPVAEDPRIYESPAVYPAQALALSHQADYAGQSFAVLYVYPVAYYPAAQRVVVHTRIAFELTGHGGRPCGDYLPDGGDAGRSDRCRAQLAAAVLNPQDIAVRTAPAGSADERGLAPGDCEYLVISPADWAGAWEPLVDWKHRRGLTAGVVTTEWIYAAGYGGTPAQQIRAFLAEARSAWGLEYVLLGGDTDRLPTSYRSIFEEEIPNDTYYADLDADWWCELQVGRAPVHSADDIWTFVGKVLSYEQSPPLDGYTLSAFFTGFDLSEFGSGEGEGTKIAIGELYLPDEWQLTTEYDSEPGPHFDDAVAGLNAGPHLVNHADHSSTYVMGVGSVNHGAHLSVDDMAALVNGARQSVLYTLGCWAGDFDNDNTCIGEAFVRNPLGGGVAFVGNSRYGWYIPGTDDGVSARFDRMFFQTLFQGQHEHVGTAFSWHKNLSFEDDNYYHYIFTELTLIGDPELPIWTAEPAVLEAAYPAELEVGILTDFAVAVTAGGQPVSSATVCVMQGTEFYERALTDESGLASIAIVPTVAGLLSVTVSGRNCVPHLGTAAVLPESAPYVLSLDIAGDGAVFVDPLQETYASGTPVTLTAAPNAGWCFDHWEHALAGTVNPQALTMDGNRVVLAVFAPDCDGNAVADALEIATGTADDCNGNGIPDACDIADQTSADCQPNGVPDECDVAPPEYVEMVDNCAEAQIICPPQIYYGSTADATLDGGSSCFAGAAPDAWYYYSPAGNGYLSLSLCGSSFDTVLSVHSACPGLPENEIACNNDSCGSASQLMVSVQYGAAYWIRVSGAGDAAGDFALGAAGPLCLFDDVDADSDGVPDVCEGACLAPGDANCDGSVNAFDIDAFVLALTGPQQWQAQFDCNFLCANDCNDDGAVNAFDIDAFVTVLTVP